MGYQYDDEDDEDFEFEPKDDEQTPKGLRKAYEALKRKHSKLETEFATLKTNTTKSALSEVLKNRGLRPGLARHMLRDEVDPTNEKSVDEWLEDNAEDFGIDLSNGSSQEGDASQNEQRASNFARLQNAQANALPAESKLAELDRRMDAAVTPEEINAILAEAGPLIN